MAEFFEGKPTEENVKKKWKDGGMELFLLKNGRYYLWLGDGGSFVGKQVAELWIRIHASTSGEDRHMRGGFRFH